MNSSNSIQFFKTLQLIFSALLFGQIVFCGVMWWLLSRIETVNETGFLSSNSLLAIFIFAWMVFISFFLYRKRSLRGERLGRITEKLTHYRISSIFRWAMLEMGNLLLVLIAYFDQNQKLMLLFALGIFIFWMTRPSVEAFSTDYQLAETERNKL